MCLCRKVFTPRKLKLAFFRSAFVCLPPCRLKCLYLSSFPCFCLSMSNEGILFLNVHSESMWFKIAKSVIRVITQRFSGLRDDPRITAAKETTSYAPINVKPEGGEVGHRVGILTFSKTNYQNPHPRAKNNCQN